MGGDGGSRHWLVRMEWRPAGWSVCLPLLIFPCTTKSRSPLLAPGGPGKRAIKWLWCGGGLISHIVTACLLRFCRLAVTLSCREARDYPDNHHCSNDVYLRKMGSDVS